MTQHYTRNTISVAAWCGKCQRQTQHRIDDRRKGPCLRCIDRLEKQHAAPSAPAAQQQSLFKETA